VRQDERRLGEQSTTFAAFNFHIGRHWKCWRWRGECDVRVCDFGRIVAFRVREIEGFDFVGERIVLLGLLAVEIVVILGLLVPKTNVRHLGRTVPTQGIHDFSRVHPAAVDFVVFEFLLSGWAVHGFVHAELFYEAAVWLDLRTRLANQRQCG